jgi:betaine-aldehyde dehydrogenase
LPEGLFQVIVGSGSVVGQRFVSHPDVRKVVFTGRPRSVSRWLPGCARALKPVTLELGGKSANVVFADADLEAAAAAVPGSVFDNAGQDCCARSRLLVQRSVYDRFLEMLEPAVTAWRWVIRGARTPRWARSSRPRTATRSRASSRGPTSPSAVPRP